MLDLELKGRIALVTGGSEGIGRAIASKLVEEGCRVAICARRPDVLEQAAAAMGEGVLAVPADVTQAPDLERFFAAAVEEFGGVDILVSNAGRSAANYFEDTTEAMWQEDFDLKFWAAVRLARLAVPRMKAQGRRAIVHITHPGGKAPDAHSVPTSISRAAGIAFTKALSKDMAAHNIRVNTVCLTNIKTAQSARAWKASGTELTYGEWCAQQGREIPLGRMGEADEVADLVSFLVSERAAFITGASINIDGGSSATV